MKKIAVFIILLLSFSYSAFSEQEEFQVEGEWYGTSSYTDFDCYNIKVNEDGNYIISAYKSEVILHKEGFIEQDGIEEKIDIVEFSDDAFFAYNLYYDSLQKMNVIGGYLIIKTEGRVTCRIISGASLVLLINGKAIKYNGDGKAEYLRAGTQLFMTDGESYTRGIIKHFGDDFFIYEIDSEPYIPIKRDDYEINYGTPLMLFFRSSIVMK